MTITHLMKLTASGLTKRWPSSRSAWRMNLRASLSNHMMNCLMGTSLHETTIQYHHEVPENSSVHGRGANGRTTHQDIRTPRCACMLSWRVPTCHKTRSNGVSQGDKEHESDGGGARRGARPPHGTATPNFEKGATQLEKYPSPEFPPSCAPRLSQYVINPKSRTCVGHADQWRPAGALKGEENLSPS